MQETIVLKEQTPMSSHNRVLSIDRFRGFAIMLVLMFGAAQLTGDAAPWLQQFSTHDLSIAWCIIPHYAVYDLGAPFFIFACGLSYAFSFASMKRKYGLRGAYKKSAIRSIRLIGIGSLLLFAPSSTVGLVSLILMIVTICAFIIVALISKKHKQAFTSFYRVFNIVLFWLGIALILNQVVEIVLYFCHYQVPDGNWSVLPSIGFAMLLLVPFLNLKPHYSIIVSILGTIAYTAAHYYIGETTFAFFNHGGMLGSFGWALLMLYSKTLIDMRKLSKPLMYIYALCLIGIGVTLFFAELPSKHSVNTTYILISFGFSFIAFIIFECFNKVKVKYDIFAIAGRNTLLLYVLHPFISFPVGICINALVSYIQVPEWLGTILVLVFLFIYYLLMVYLCKKINARGFRLKN